jgi:hypothetical protein
MALVQGAGLETEVWHLPAKVPEIDWNIAKPTGKQLDAPPQVTFELDGAKFTVKIGDEVAIPASLAYALPMLAPQLVKGAAPKTKAA